jgi:SAM-dependent methyltransferase
MTQNIYDDPAFFTRYSELPRSVEGLDGAPEWPALRGLLPDMRCRRVLDLGCGFGWFCRWARENGAASVTGVDVSERMLARARTETRDPAIVYLRADLETFRPDAAAFNLAYSSLAFHYLEHLDRLFGRVRAALVPGGRFVFSVEHPVMTAPADPAWSVDARGRDIWPVSGYLDEGRRSTTWLADGVIKQHRTIETYFTLLRRNGFNVTHLIEWAPGHEQIVAHPDWKKERERPFFLLAGCDISH